MMGIIELSEATVLRGRSKVLDKWSISVNSGEIVCLAGENGCGKSTVIETASGLIPLENGSATISEQLVRDSEGRRGRPNFGLCLQDDCVMGDELVGERILDAAGFDFDVQGLLKTWGLDHRIHDRIAMLSGGQRRKVALLSGLIPAMISQTPVAVLLDEPDSGLDDDSIKKLADTLRNLAAGGHAILVSSHDSRIIEVSHRVIRFPYEEEEFDTGWWKIHSNKERKSTQIKCRAPPKSENSFRISEQWNRWTANIGSNACITRPISVRRKNPDCVYSRTCSNSRPVRKSNPQAKS